MPVKLIMTWDISPEHEQEYFEFVVAELIPGVQRLGLEPIEAWVTLYGNYPQIQVGMLAVDASAARRILNSEGWNRLQERLLAFIKNFTFKIVPAKGGFQF